MTGRESSWQRRWNPVFGEWTVIAATTGNRPWSGKKTSVDVETTPSHDKDCYLCPGVTRASGEKNPDYKGVWAFDNDYACFSPKAPLVQSDSPCEVVADNRGRCRVLCWSEFHNATLSQLSPESMREVVNLWSNEYTTLSQEEDIQYVLIFENKGKEVGVSNLHPHGQIYGTGYLPGRISRMRQAMKEWHNKNKKTVLSSLLENPTWGELTVDENQYFSQIVPWAARFPYETWILPKRPVAHIAAMTEEEREALSEIFQRAVIRYDNLFQRDCPNITLHFNAPTDGGEQKSWHYFCCFQPPLRDTEKLKYLAGFESGGGDIVNPVAPERAAQQLKAVK